MKNQFLKSITLALTLSMLPMTVLHAMNKQEPKKTENQSYLQRAMNYVKEVGYDNALYNTASFTAGLVAASLIGTALHEAGHALMAEAIRPGSVEHIEIASLKPHVRLCYDWRAKTSPKEKMAALAAGPIAGTLGSYACAKGLQLLCEYQNTGNLGNAVEKTRNTPMLANSSKSPFIQGLQLGFGAGVWVHGILQMHTIARNIDGDQFLSNALYGKHGQKIPLSIAIPWNAAVIAGTGLSMYKAVDQSIEYTRKQEQDQQIAFTIDCSK